MEIPDHYHFIHGMTPHDRPFSLIHYLAVASCHKVNRPARIHLHCGYEPSGLWWQRARPYLNLVKVRPPDAVSGQRLERPAHKADVLRLQILLERGGIYLDLDVLSLRPFAPLRSREVVLGEEMGVGLCNAVILARPGAEFLRRWLAEYSSFRSDSWNEHSVRVPRRLADEIPEHVHVLDPRKFYWPMYWPHHLEAFFLKPGSNFCSESYCTHLWESITGEQLSRLTVAEICSGDSEFCRLARPYVDPRWAAQPAPISFSGR